MAINYAQVNIDLNTNSATVVDQLNGRQGDNNREVFFWLKKGEANYSLVDKTVTLKVKDAAGMVKTASTMNNTTGLAAGRFSMLIPYFFYQKEGVVQEAWLQVNDASSTITSIPITFQVVKNNIVVTQSQSEMYVDGVQQTINEFNKRMTTAMSNLNDYQNQINDLQSKLDTVTNLINNKGVPQFGADNTFTGKNTFTKTINANISGSAASANDPNAAHVNSTNDFSSYKQTFGMIGLQGIAYNVRYSQTISVGGVNLLFYQTPIGVQVRATGAINSMYSGWDWASTGQTLSPNIKPPILDTIMLMPGGCGIANYSYRVSFSYQIKVIAGSGEIQHRLMRMDTDYVGSQDATWKALLVSSMNVNGSTFYPTFL